MSNDGSIASRLEEVDELLEDANGGVSKLGPGDRDRFAPLIEAARHDEIAVSDALERLSKAGAAASSDIAESTQHSLSDLEAEVRAILGDLRSTLASERADLFEAAEQQLEAWRARLDHMSLQADLARLEARDEWERAETSAENAWLAARNHLRAAAADFEATVDTAREGINRSMSEVRAAVTAAGAVLNRCLESR